MEGNTLRLDWESVAPKHELNYIMGNPLFVGFSLRSDKQQTDMAAVFYDNSRAGRLDYVAAWYRIAGDYIQGTNIEGAFVSTNSIVQGEQVPILWDEMFNKYNVFINFAYRTFVWNSEAKEKAAVYCVIIGFSRKERNQKILLEDERAIYVDKINGYLVNANNVFIELRGKAPNNMPKLVQGNKPWDGGFLILSPEERTDLLNKYPSADKFIRLYIGSYEFINNKTRYCL